MTYKSIKSKNNVIYKGILYLENHYLEDITVEQLADMCHTSEGNFRRLFKKYKNMPPISYRNYLRMKKALMLLNSKEYSIVEVVLADLDQDCIKTSMEKHGIKRAFNSYEEMVDNGFLSQDIRAKAEKRYIFTKESTI